MIKKNLSITLEDQKVIFYIKKINQILIFLLIELDLFFLYFF